MDGAGIQTMNSNLPTPNDADDGQVPERRRVESPDGETIEVESKADPLSVDYHRIEPPNKPYEDYNTAQRRAILLERIERVGHPQALNQSYAQMGDEFGVAKSTIHRDLSVLAAWVAENVERDHVSIMDNVFRGAILSLVESNDMLEAVEAGKEWFDWLAQMGAIDRVPEQVDIDQTVRHAGGESESYEVLDESEVNDLRQAQADGGETHE